MKKLPVYRVGIQIDLTSVSGSKFCVGDRNYVGFSVSTEIGMFCVRVKIDLVFVWGSKITCVQCEHRKRLGFYDGGRNSLDPRVGDRT